MNILWFGKVMLGFVPEFYAHSALHGIAELRG